MAAIKCFLLDTNLDHSLATIKFDIWLKFCSNRSIINLAIGQKLSKTADWTIKSKMAARRKFWQGKTLNHSRDLIELDIWWKFHQNPRSGLSLTQVFPNMLHLRKCPPLRFSNFLLLPSNFVKILINLDLAVTQLLGAVLLASAGAPWHNFWQKTLSYLDNDSSLLINVW